MNKSLTKTLIIIGIVFVCVFFLLTVIVLRGEEDRSNSNKPMPIAQYDNPLYKLLLNYVYEDEFQEADSSERMGLFINELSNIENGTEACEIGVVSFDVDEYNHSIKFCDSDGIWWRFRSTDLSIEYCGVLCELRFLTSSEDYSGYDFETQVGIFCQKAESLINEEANINKPYIVPETITYDSEKHMIKFKLSDGIWMEYYFDTDKFVSCDVLSELLYLIQTQEYVDGDTDKRMKMFEDKLVSLSEGVADNMNGPLIDPQSIIVDQENHIIYYTYGDQAHSYSFTDNISGIL